MVRYRSEITSLKWKLQNISDQLGSYCSSTSVFIIISGFGQINLHVKFCKYYIAPQTGLSAKIWLFFLIKNSLHFSAEVWSFILIRSDSTSELVF